MSRTEGRLGTVDLINPQSLNRYAYVLNNPTTLIDPLGLFHDPCGDPYKVACGGDAVHSRPSTLFGADEFDLAQLGILPGTALPSGICPAQYSSCTALPNGQIFGTTGPGSADIFTFGSTSANNGSGPCTSYALEVGGCSVSGVQVIGQTSWNPNTPAGPASGTTPALIPQHKGQRILTKNYGDYLICIYNELITKPIGEGDPAGVTVLVNAAAFALRRSHPLFLIPAAFYDLNLELTARATCRKDVYGE